MPEPIRTDADRRDEQTDSRQHCDVAGIPRRGRAMVVRCFLDPGRRDIECPRQHERNGETDPEQNDQHGQDELRRMESREHGGRNLDRQPGRDRITDRDAIDAPLA